MYEQIASNKRKSMALFAGFFLLYALIALALYEVSGPDGAVIVGVIAVGMIGITLYGGDNLAVQVAGGQEVTSKEQAPELWRLVENLAITAGLPMPRLFISSDPSPNAFAAGRSPEQAIVCVNQGLLEVLDDQELQGVLAHEMSHIRNYDVRLMTYAAVLAGSIGMIAQLLLYSGAGRSRGRDNNPLGAILFIATIILAPLAATIIQLSISRKREFVADASGADLTRYPQGLASALSVISGSTVQPTHNESAIAHMMIAPQMNASGTGSKKSVFSTHPPTEERIARLMEMAGGVPHQRGLPVAQTFREALGGGPQAPSVGGGPQAPLVEPPTRDDRGYPPGWPSA